MTGYILTGIGIAGMIGSIAFAVISSAKIKKENTKISHILDAIYKTNQ